MMDKTKKVRYVFSVFMVMLMVGADSIRDVIAFPKVKDASCLMTEAPSPVDAAQLEELGLEVEPQAEEETTEE